MYVWEYIQPFRCASIRNSCSCSARQSDAGIGYLTFRSGWRILWLVQVLGEEGVVFSCVGIREFLKDFEWFGILRWCHSIFAVDFVCTLQICWRKDVFLYCTKLWRNSSLVWRFGAHELPWPFLMRSVFCKLCKVWNSMTSSKELWQLDWTNVYEEKGACIGMQFGVAKIRNSCSCTENQSDAGIGYMTFRSRWRILWLMRVLDEGGQSSCRILAAVGNWRRSSWVSEDFKWSRIVYYRLICKVLILIIVLYWCFDAQKLPRPSLMLSLLCKSCKVWMS